MEYKTYRVFVFFVSLFFVLYFGLQLFGFFTHPKATEMAIPYSFTDSIPLEGMVIRSEEILDESHRGVIRYNVPNAQKVNQNTPLATTFSSKEDLAQSIRVDQIKRRIALLQEIEQLDPERVDQKKTRGSPPQNQLAALYAMETHDLNAIATQSEDFLVAMLQQKKTLDPTISYIDERERLEREMAQIAYQPGEAIVSPKNGFFSNRIDGYESLRIQDARNDLSLASVDALLAREPGAEKQELRIGKIITSTRWYLMARLPTRSVERLFEGQVVSLAFPEHPQSPVRATIELIRIDAAAVNSTLLLYCDYLNENTINLRKEQPEILLGEQTGIKVNRHALRMQNDQPGVYVNINDKPVFRQIDIIDSQDDFVVSAITEDKRYLQLYDQLILGS